MNNQSNIIIIGITGVGKTTIGKILADKLSRQFIDLDKQIEQRCGVDIPTIFAIEGEKKFREREAIELKSVLFSHSNIVLSVGGGCVIQAESRQIIINSDSYVIQLLADIATIVERVSKSPTKRPLLAKDDNIEEKIINLYNARKQFYDTIADYTINSSKLKPWQVVESITGYLGIQFPQLNNKNKFY